MLPTCVLGHVQHFALDALTNCGVFQVRILEWVATSYSRVSSDPGSWTHILLLQRCCAKSLQYCPNSLQPYGLWPDTLFCPWDSPGNNAGVGCHALLRGSSRPRDRTSFSQSSALAGGFVTTSATTKWPFSSCKLEREMVRILTAEMKWYSIILYSTCCYYQKKREKPKRPSTGAKYIISDTEMSRTIMQS